MGSALARQADAHSARPGLTAGVRGPREPAPTPVDLLHGTPQAPLPGRQRACLPKHDGTCSRNDLSCQLEPDVEQLEDPVRWTDIVERRSGDVVILELRGVMTLSASPGVSPRS